MKNLLIPVTVVILSIVTIMCSKHEYKKPLQEEIATAKPVSNKCYTVCDVNKNPDLQLVTNAEEDTLFASGTIDSTSYFWTRYHVRSFPITLVSNYVSTIRDSARYGWKAGDTINRIRLQCLVENIAPFDSTCVNDWLYNESQGYYDSTIRSYFFNGLFLFDTYEKGNGNSWKFLYTDYKKEFFPSSIPNTDYLYNTNFCYYLQNGERAIQAQMGDFYYNYFRFPNHDGNYKLVLKFNPVIKGCRAIKETNYENNEKTIYIQIVNGQVIIL